MWPQYDDQNHVPNPYPRPIPGEKSILRHAEIKTENPYKREVLTHILLAS